MGGPIPIFSGLKEALTLAKEAQTLPVLRERLALAHEQLVIAEKQVDELELEITDLFRENRELRKENESFRAKVAEYEHKPIVVDIGPCAIKLNKQGQKLVGFYCNACGSQYDGYYSERHGQMIHCRKCGEHKPSRDADEALKFYLESEARQNNIG